MPAKSNQTTGNKTNNNTNTNTNSIVVNPCDYYPYTNKDFGSTKNTPSSSTGNLFDDGTVQHDMKKFTLQKSAKDQITSNDN